MGTERLYDSLWSNTPIRLTLSRQVSRIVARYLPSSGVILELGPGTRPRFPIKSSTTFLDLSPEAVKALRRVGATAFAGNLEKNLPLPDEHFDVVGAFHVIEHLKDETVLFGEIVRVLKPGGYFICGIPLNMAYWTAWDSFVGHYRRYAPQDLIALAQRCGLKLRAIYPVRGILPFLVTTALARIFAPIFVSMIRHTPHIVYAGERLLTTPLPFVQHSFFSLLQQGNEGKLNLQTAVTLRRCPEAVFIFQR